MRGSAEEEELLGLHRRLSEAVALSREALEEAGNLDRESPGSL